MSLPPVEIPLGAMRFNSDSQKLEYFNGDIWMQIHTFSPNLDGGARGVMMGGALDSSPSRTAAIDYINIASAGNAADFGDLDDGGKNAPNGTASRTKGLCAGGSHVPARQTHISAITFSSTGDSVDHGDLSVARAELGACGNETRAVFAGGSAPSGDSNEIDYITTATGGTAVDWGTNLSDARERVWGGINSPTRGVFGGGQSSAVNTIDFVTITTTGTHGDFGDMTGTDVSTATCGSNSIRGIIPSRGTGAHIEYITIATRGNSQKFGDMSQTRQFGGAVTSPTRAVLMGGYVGPFSGSSAQTTIDYVTIQTEGKAVDFGDLTTDKYMGANSSNAHGGLG
tara:strand:+ start:301 stop:1323 length:1023 start_codon:yes stop_codon:yes gene_type:complete